MLNLYKYILFTKLGNFCVLTNLINLDNYHILNENAYDNWSKIGFLSALETEEDKIIMSNVLQELANFICEKGYKCLTNEETNMLFPLAMRIFKEGKIILSPDTLLKAFRSHYYGIYNKLKDKYKYSAIALDYQAQALAYTTEIINRIAI